MMQLKEMLELIEKHYPDLHAYLWLASILAAPLGQAHIGYLGEYYCRQVIEASKQQLENAKRHLIEKADHAVKRAI